MPQPLVAGNWKMYGSLAEIAPLLMGIEEGVGSLRNTEVAVCPPFVYVPLVAQALVGSTIALGAQNLCDADAGAFTGEVSGAMLRDYNCRYVIVGHSERRTLFGEHDQLVAQKFVRAQKCGLIPILCVGESLRERETGRTEELVDRQLKAVLDRVAAVAFKHAVIAYEPVWAIGTGKTATPQQAQDVHAFIRRVIGESDPAVASELRILYGGSVKGANAKGLFAMADIDGGLIGGASLSAEEFTAICRAAENRVE